METRPRLAGRVSAALGSSTQSQGWIFEARARRLSRAGEILSLQAELTRSPNSAPGDSSCAERGGGGNPQLSHQTSEWRTGVMKARPDSVHVAARHLISVTARNELPCRATPPPPPLPTCRGAVGGCKWRLLLSQTLLSTRCRDHKQTLQWPEV